MGVKDCVKNLLGIVRVKAIGVTAESIHVDKAMKICQELYCMITAS